MHYLITGHTGFKGSWLSLMLQMKGHDVSGISLNPPQKSLFIEADLEGTFKYDFRIDIRNREELTKAINKINPEIIVHLAAQPLVRESYKYPIETFETNVIGTLNVLEASKELMDLKAALIITTDKVYKNHNHFRGYIESDELAGADPYSASKAAADIATQSWIKSFATRPIAIARAGNVIGGGDWAKDRIIPDLVNAYTREELPVIRNPQAIRPWQHVLDCLNGYLSLIDYQITNHVGGEWNFGPRVELKHTVAELVETFSKKWGIKGDSWTLDTTDRPHEANFLLLDSEKARVHLNWEDKLDFDSTVDWTCAWFKKNQYTDSRKVTLDQIEKFLDFTQLID